MKCVPFFVCLPSHRGEFRYIMSVEKIRLQVHFKNVVTKLKCLNEVGNDKLSVENEINSIYV